MIRRRIATTALNAALAAGLLGASPAAADDATCSYVPAGILPAFVPVSLTPSPGTFTRLLVTLPAFGSEFQVAAANGTADCGVGNVNNTDLVSITDGSPGGNASLDPHLLTVGSASEYAPGATPEPGDSDEIEFGVGLGGGRDVLALNAFVGAATVRAGATGQNNYLNLNAAELTGIDQDVAMTGVDELQFFGDDPEDDDFRGTGGLGTGSAPIPIRINANGFRGDDFLAGGAAGDLLNGSFGADDLIGAAGADKVLGYEGEDTVRGGKGRDTTAGGGSADRILGGAGADSVLGGNGQDTLQAGKGPDKLNGGAGRDIVVGGPGFDRCQGGSGRDSFIGCELIFNR